jgi:flagellar biosynthesis GTPase FlhF
MENLQVFLVIKFTIFYTALKNGEIKPYTFVLYIEQQPDNMDMIAYLTSFIEAFKKHLAGAEYIYTFVNAEYQSFFEEKQLIEQKIADIRDARKKEEERIKKEKEEEERIKKEKEELEKKEKEKLEKERLEKEQKEKDLKDKEKNVFETPGAESEDKKKDNEPTKEKIDNPQSDYK